jgi:hypothetical protein
MMDRPYRLPFPYRTGCSDRSCPAASCWNFQQLIYSRCTQPSVKSYVTQVRHDWYSIVDPYLLSAIITVLLSFVHCQYSTPVPSSITAYHPSSPMFRALFYQQPLDFQLLRQFFKFFAKLQNAIWFRN